MLIETEKFLKLHSDKAIFFLCPYATPIDKLKFAIRSLSRAGYSVIAIGYTTGIFQTGEPDRLFEAIQETKEYIRSIIKELQTKKFKEFGFVGSSLGGFVAYNCLYDVPELSWGILNTGGNITEAIWNFQTEKKRFEANGFNRKKLEKVWYSLQYPKLGDLSTKKYILITSKADETSGYIGAMKCFDLIKAAGPNVKLIVHKKLNHRNTIIRNLLRVRKLVTEVAKNN